VLKLLISLRRLSWAFALLLALAAAFVCRGGYEEEAAVIWLASLIILLPIWRQQDQAHRSVAIASPTGAVNARHAGTGGLDAYARSVHEPEDKDHNHDQAKDAAEPRPAIIPVSVITAPAPKEQNQDDNDQN
jgi:hypothetical protein